MSIGGSTPEDTCLHCWVALPKFAVFKACVAAMHTAPPVATTSGGQQYLLLSLLRAEPDDMQGVSHKEVMELLLLTQVGQ